MSLRVQVLRQFIQALTEPLKAAGARESFEGIGEALRPFEDWELGAFRHILQQAEELVRSGRLPQPTARSMLLDKLQAAQNSLSSQLHRGDGPSIAESQSRLKEIIQDFMSEAGLSGKIAIQAKWATARLAELNTKRLREAYNQLANRLSKPEDYQDPSFVRELDAFVVVAIKDIKSLAKELKLKPAGKSVRPMVLSMLQSTSGVSQTALDATVVESHVAKLKSLDAIPLDAFPEREADLELKALGSVPLPELIRIAERFGIENPGTKKKDVMKRLESRLKGSFNAREANVV